MGVTPLISINCSANSRPQFNTIFFSELDAENKQAFSIAFRKTKYPDSGFPKLFTPRQKAGSKNETFQSNKTAAN